MLSPEYRDLKHKRASILKGVVSRTDFSTKGERARLEMRGCSFLALSQKASVFCLSDSRMDIQGEGRERKGCRCA